MEYLYAALLFAVGEFLAWLVFRDVKRRMWPKGSASREDSRRATVTGILERLVLFTGFFRGYPQIVIPFAVLKLGTRLQEDQRCPKSNSYFLVGNLLSIFFAMVYAIVIGELTG